jgi:hypothetical protein
MYARVAALLPTRFSKSAAVHPAISATVGDLHVAVNLSVLDAAERRRRRPDLIPRAGDLGEAELPTARFSGRAELQVAAYRASVYSPAADALFVAAVAVTPEQAPARPGAR